MILHFCPRADWLAAQELGEYRHESLVTEGFVHCSDPGTVHLPAGRLFPGRTDLVLLVLDRARLGVPVRWEPGAPPRADGVWFPHVYGPIPLDAVTAVHDFPLTAAGAFELPPALANPTPDPPAPA